MNSGVGWQDAEDFEELEQDNAALLEEVHALRQRVKGLVRENAELGKRLFDSEMETEQLQKEKAELEQKNLELSQKNMNLMVAQRDDDQVAKLKKEIAGLRRRNQTLNSTVSKIEWQRLVLEDQVKTLLGEVGTATTPSDEVTNEEGIEVLGLSVRTYNLLKRAKKHTMAQLLDNQMSELMKILHFGHVSANEVYLKLAERGKKLIEEDDEHKAKCIRKILTPARMKLAKTSDIDIALELMPLLYESGLRTAEDVSMLTKNELRRLIGHDGVADKVIAWMHENGFHLRKG